MASLAVAKPPGLVGTAPLSGIGLDYTTNQDQLNAFTTGEVEPKVVTARRARTRTNAPEAPVPEPTPPPEPGPTLDFPLQVVRQPRGGVAVNGTRLDRLLLEMDITNNRYLAADAFRCTLALAENDPDFGLAFWQDAVTLDMEFFAGFGVDEPPSTSLLSGRVDELTIDLASRTITLLGRDYTADLIERQVVEKYPNKTSSEIIKILAGLVGLTPVVTETSALAGVYYRADHSQMSDETTAWNLATYLAEREGFDVYVKGKELHFKPPPDPVTASKWALTYEPSSVDVRSARAPTSTLQLTKSLTVSRDITVKVVSWDSARKKAIEGTSRSALPARSSNGRGLGSAGGRQKAITHVFRLPNLTQDQAEARARQLAEDIAKHLRTFEATLPGDPAVDMRTIVTLRGSGGSFDTDYHLDTIQRSISQDRGFTMQLRGRNVKPGDQATL